MNFSPLPVIMLMVGIVLIYAGVKDVDPREVVKNALKGKSTGASGGGRVAGKINIPPPSGFDSNAGAGQGSGNSGGGSW